MHVVFLCCGHERKVFKHVLDEMLEQIIPFDGIGVAK